MHTLHIILGLLVGPSLGYWQKLNSPTSGQPTATFDIAGISTPPLYSKGLCAGHEKVGTMRWVVFNDGGCIGDTPAQYVDEHGLAKYGLTYNQQLVCLGKTPPVSSESSYDEVGWFKSIWLSTPFAPFEQMDFSQWGKGDPEKPIGGLYPQLCNTPKYSLQAGWETQGVPGQYSVKTMKNLNSGENGYCITFEEHVTCARMWLNPAAKTVDGYTSLQMEASCDGTVSWPI